MSKKLDLKGKRFGRLVVLEEAGKTKQRSIVWSCLCDCGNICEIDGISLRSGNTKSCGCLRKDLLTKHNMYRTSTYRIWAAMLQRCNNKKNIHYEYYGGRGIQICKSWFKFIDFFKDMGKRPKGLTLERIQNDLGYSKENCCWATRCEQRHNQRIRSDNTTGVVGVIWVKERQKYLARIEINSKTIFLGSFVDLEDAAKARKQAEQRYWRE